MDATVIFYVVRDRLASGKPANWVSVWHVRPRLIEHPNGAARWCGDSHDDDGGDKPVGWLCNLWLAAAAREYGSYPSSERQVFVVRRRSAEDRNRVSALLDGIERRAARFPQHG